MQISDIEYNIASIVKRNDIVDEEILGIKSDMISLADKILTIKVSSIHGRFSIESGSELIFDNSFTGGHILGCNVWF